MMSKLKFFFIITVVVLVVLLGSTMFRTPASTVEYSEVQRRQLFQAESEWILKFDILNHEGKDTSYTITSTVGNKPYTEYVTIRNDGMFRYVQYIRPGTLGETGLSFAVYKEGEESPFEQATYRLK